MPDATTDLAQLIADEAALPKSSENDGQAAEGRPLGELVAADKHLATKAATSGNRSGWRCLRAARVIPPGGS